MAGKGGGKNTPDELQSEAEDALGQAIADLDAVEAGSLADLINSQLDAAISTRATPSDIDAASAAEVDAEIEEVLSRSITDFSSVGAGSIAALVNSQLDAAVSTRSTHGDPDPNGYIDAPISEAGETATATNTQAELRDPVEVALTDLDPTEGSIADLLNSTLDAAISTRSMHDDPDPNGYIDAPISEAGKTATNSQAELRGPVETALTNLSPSGGSIADLINSNLDAAVSTRSNHADPDPNGYIDQPISNAGKTATDKNSTGELRDPVETALTNLSPSSGSIADLINSNLDVAVSTRSSHADPDPNNHIDTDISSRSSHNDPDPNGYIDAPISNAGKTATDKNSTAELRDPVETDFSNLSAATQSVAGVLDTIVDNNDVTNLEASGGGGTDWSSKTPKSAFASNQSAGGGSTATLISVSGSGYVTEAYLAINDTVINFKLILDGSTVVSEASGEGDPAYDTGRAGATARSLYRFNSSFEVRAQNTSGVGKDVSGGAFYVLD
jgi:hypothetical protein